jgi:ACT domain-containing protein
MSNLRKEYSEYKHIQKQNFREAAEAWTEDNIILINERLNRNAIYRLNSAIQRFDNKFGKYRDRLPAISNILDNAENGLQLVITGKVGSRTTAQMLQRLSIMYNILSNFFGGDLGALLKTPAFRIAHEQPDEKIDKIIDRGHDVKEIRRNLAAALKPSDEERLIFRKVYKSFDMPTLDWNMAAKQLCCLSCNELKDLAGIEKIPMAVVDEKSEAPKIENGIDEANIGQAVSNAWQTTGKVGSQVAGGVVGGAIGVGAIGIKTLMDRFKSRSKEMTAAITKLEKYISGVEGFENVETALKSLRDKSKAATNSTFDLSGGIRGLLKHPSVVIMKQAVMASEAIEAVLKSWNEHIKDTYKDGIKPEDLPNLKKELVKRVKGRILNRIKGAITGVKPFPGLSPDDIIDAVMSVASKGITEQEQMATPPSGATKLQESNANQTFIKTTHLLFEMHQNINEYMLTEDYKDLEKLVQQIGTFEKSKEGNVETGVIKDIESAQKTGSAQDQGTQQKTKPTNISNQIKAAEDAATKETDITQEDIDSAFKGFERATEAEIGKAKLEQLNKAIAALQIPQVVDINSANKFLQTYRTLLVKDLEIGQLITILANNVPQNIQEKRNIAINIIKRIISEQVRILPPPQTVGVPSSSSAGPVSAAPAAAPAEVNTQSIQNAGADAGKIANNPRAAGVVNDQIKALEIPGITDVASVTKFITDYISIIGKMKEVKQLLALVKDVSDVNKYPKANTASAQTPTSGTNPATGTTVGSTPAA